MKINFVPIKHSQLEVILILVFLLVLSDLLETWGILTGPHHIYDHMLVYAIAFICIVKLLGRAEKYKAIIVISNISLLLNCIMFYYSKCFFDFLVFLVCMYVVLKVLVLSKYEKENGRMSAPNYEDIRIIDGLFKRRKIK